MLRKLRIFTMVICIICLVFCFLKPDKDAWVFPAVSFLMVLFIVRELSSESLRSLTDRSIIIKIVKGYGNLVASLFLLGIILFNLAHTFYTRVDNTSYRSSYVAPADQRLK